ncbi:MAG: hypothetical protein GY874_16625 [Desulfobacteraceae bacterium]|nr:hypothetical protein [Desulfobacteraceae bacterium]
MYGHGEICPLTGCNFGHLPKAQKYEGSLEAEPWFIVKDNDVFPDEFNAFLGLTHGVVKKTFLQHHSDLLEPEFWKYTQQQIRAGQLICILLYHPSQRLLP